MKRFLLPLVSCSLWLWGHGTARADQPLAPLDGVADEDDSDDDGDLDDFLDELLSTPTRAATVEEEISAVQDEPVAATSQVLLDEADRKRRLIKTVQDKTFLKLGRFEVTPNVAFVTNDPFLNRYIVGTNLGYHFTEIFEIEMSLGFSPDLGEADWKPLTHQLVENNKVSPDLSPLTYFGNTTFTFSPIYGKVAVLGRRIINFDIFGAFGMGFVRTSDDLKALGVEPGQDPLVDATANQIHPTTNFGGGVRVALSESVALRIEGRSLVYIETVQSDVLEMKNNFILQTGVSFFFPSM